MNSEKKEQAAEFTADQISGGAADIKSAASSYGKLSGNIRDLLKRLLVNGRKAKDVSPSERARFIETCGKASGVDYKAIVKTGIITRIAKELKFPVEAHAGTGKNVITINAKKATVADIAKAIRQIVKASVKNGKDKDEIIAAISAAIA